MKILKIASGAFEPIKRLKSAKLTGLDYSGADKFIKTGFSKAVLANASKEGKLSEDMIQQMILQRLPKTIKQAEAFVSEHPELSKDDTVQELIAHMISLARKYSGQVNGDFNHHSLESEKNFLISLLNKHKKAINPELIPDAINASSFDGFMDKKTQEAIVEELLKPLKPRQKSVIEGYFGLEDGNCKNFKQMAKQLNTATVTMSRDLKFAMRKLVRHYHHKLQYEELSSLIPFSDSFEDRLIYLIDKGKLFK